MVQSAKKAHTTHLLFIEQTQCTVYNNNALQQFNSVRTNSSINSIYPSTWTVIEPSTRAYNNTQAQSQSTEFRQR